MFSSNTLGYFISTLPFASPYVPDLLSAGPSWNGELEPLAVAVLVLLAASARTRVVWINLLLFPLFRCADRTLVLIGDVPVKKEAVEKTHVYLVDMAVRRMIAPKQVRPSGIQKQAETFIAHIVFRDKAFPA